MVASIATTSGVDENLFKVISRDGGRTNVRPKPHVSRIPDGVVISGFCNLIVAHHLEPLPHDLVVEGLVLLKRLTFDGDTMKIQATLPETVTTAMVGRRVGDVISHRLLEGHPALDAIITGSEVVGGISGMSVATINLDLDRAPFHPKRER